MDLIEKLHMYLNKFKWILISVIAVLVVIAAFIVRPKKRAVKLTPEEIKRDRWKKRMQQNI